MTVPDEAQRSARCRTPMLACAELRPPLEQLVVRQRRVEVVQRVVLERTVARLERLFHPAEVETRVVGRGEVAPAPRRVVHALPAAFAAENLVLLLRHASTGIPVDISLALQTFEAEAAAQAEPRTLGKVGVRVVPLTALLIYKMVAGRPKDLEDVRALLATGEEFDAAAVVSTLEEFDALLDTNRASDFRRLLG